MKIVVIKRVGQIWHYAMHAWLRTAHGAIHYMPTYDYLLGNLSVTPVFYILGNNKYYS